MIEQYIDHILYVMWLSELTAESYADSLRKFNNFLKTLSKNLDNPEDITYVDINKWILSQKDISNRTINKRLSAIKGILNWLKYNDKHVIDPCRIKSLKKEERAIWFYSDEEKKKILKLVDKWFGLSKEIQLRNKLLVYVLMFTGLRIHEALDIKTKDVQESIQIIGKWWKHRWTFFRPEILNIAKEYLKEKAMYSDYLFSAKWNNKYNKSWEKLDVSSAKLMFIRMSKALWIHIYAHKFRHTYATGLLKLKWSNIYNIAKLLGHKNISTTQIYLWYNNTELKNLQFSLKI